VVTSTGDGPWVSAPAKNARAATASRRSETRTSTAYPDEVIGIHLMAVGAPQHLDPATLTEEEQEYLRRVEAWDREEGAYMHQQSTRPRTLSYGLSDSPVGLLASILEKYHAWSDCAGDVSSRFSADFLLTQASLYWFTNTISTSFRPYYEYRPSVPRSLPPVSVPTAVALFPADLSQPPHSWAERTYNVVATGACREEDTSRRRGAGAARQRHRGVRRVAAPADPAWAGSVRAAPAFPACAESICECHDADLAAITPRRIEGSAAGRWPAIDRQRVVARSPRADRTNARRNSDPECRAHIAGLPDALGVRRAARNRR
jgi:hypothetical protein